MRPATERPGRTLVRLPADVEPPYEIYVNGVRQAEDVDFTVTDTGLMFDRPLMRDRIAGWRWLIGALGIGTYRQDDSVDVRYQTDGQHRVAQGLPMELVDD
jgi:hypothetical protein